MIRNPGFELADAWDRLKAAPGLLRRVGFADFDDFTSAKIGAGAYAAVFEVGDDRVLKLTTDEDDANAARAVLEAGGKVDGIVRIYEVAKLPGKITERFSDAPMSVLARRGKGGHPLRLEDTRNATLYAIVAERTVPIPFDELYGDLGAGTANMDSAMRGAYWLRERGFRYTDIHEGNIGWSTARRQAVLIDLGHHRTPRKRRPPMPVAKNPLLARPPHHVHQLRDTRWFRRMVGRSPRPDDYIGVHTATEPLIAATYAMGSCDDDYDEANGYPVLVTLDVSGLEALPDVDALVRGGEAADVARSEYRKRVADGETMDDLVDDESYGAQLEARAGDEPAAFIFEDTGSHPLQAIIDYAAASGEDAEAIFTRFLATGELPNGALTRLVGQQRYLTDFDLDRVVRVQAIRPWWRKVLVSYEDDEFEKLQALGYEVFTMDEWPFNGPGDLRTLYEAPDARSRTNVEYHGTTSAVIDMAFPKLIMQDAPFPVRHPDDDDEEETS